MTNWTTPYRGVTHLGQFSMRGGWATVTDYGTFAQLVKWHTAPHCTEENHSTVEAAKKAGEAFVAQHL